MVTGMAAMRLALKGRDEYLAGNSGRGSGGSGGSGGGGNFTYTPEMRLWEGETKRVRFNGSQDEPLILRYHTVQPSNNPLVCAFQFEAPQHGDQDRGDGTSRGQYAHLLKEPHPGCVYCFQYKAEKDKRIGFSNRAVYSLVDRELYHRIPNQQGTTDREGNVYINDELCSNNSRCAYCRNPDPAISDRFYGGQKKWRIPLKSSAGLLGQVNKIQEFCVCCWQPGAALGSGIIQTQAYTCSNPECQADIPIDDFDPLTMPVYHCKACNVVGVPVETCVCTNGCEGARRTTLWDGDWSVTRTGTSTMTSYTFGFLGVSEPTEDVLACIAPDLSAEEKPSAAKKMAEKLGIENPFGNQGGHQRAQLQAPRGQQVQRPNSGPAPALQRPGAVAPQQQAQRAQVQAPVQRAPAPIRGQVQQQPAQKAPAPGVGYEEPRPAQIQRQAPAPIQKAQPAAVVAPKPLARPQMATTRTPAPVAAAPRTLALPKPAAAPLPVRGRMAPPVQRRPDAVSYGDDSGSLLNPYGDDDIQL